MPISREITAFWVQEDVDYGISGYNCPSLQKSATGRNTVTINLRKTPTYRTLSPRCGWLQLNIYYGYNPILKTTSSSLNSTVETLCRTLRLRRSANQRPALMLQRPIETRPSLANTMTETAFGNQSQVAVFLIAVWEWVISIGYKSQGLFSQSEVKQV